METIYYDGYGKVDFSSLKGDTIVEIIGLSPGHEEVFIKTKSGMTLKMWYDHDCCASCSVEDVIGDINDIIGHEILLAEEVESNENPEDIKREDESFTWTFYKLATIKGSVTIRWYGSSNGFYSESVSLERIKVLAEVEE